MPERIEKNQMDRQQGLVEIEPNGRAGLEQPLEGASRADRAGHAVRLPLDVHQGEDARDREKRSGAEEIRQLEPAAPGEEAEEDKRKDGHGALAQHGQDEGEETQPVGGV